MTVGIWLDIKNQFLFQYFQKNCKHKNSKFQNDYPSFFELTDAFDAISRFVSKIRGAIHT